MTALLGILRDHANLVEADLSRFHQIRYSDRWRFDEHGNRKLYLREIWVRITDLPGDARIVKHYNDGRPRWTDETYLLSDLVHAMTGKAHPARPKPPKNSADKRETPQRAQIRKQRIADRRRRQMAAQRENN